MRLGYLLLFILGLSQVAKTQTSCGFVADDDSYGVTVTVTPSNLDINSCWGSGFNYRVGADYSVVVTGTPPPSFYTLQGTLTCNGIVSTFDLPNTGSGGIGTLFTTNATSGLPCPGTTLSDMNCGSLLIEIGAPNLPSQKSCPVILPIELAYFDVQRLADGFQYNWQTLSEKDNDYFTVEYSYSLKEFQEITRVNSSGNSFETIDYESFSNDWFLNGVDNVIYFRLKQVDYDGNFTYSHIVSVSLDVVEKQGIELFPNPATDQVTVRTNVLDEDVQHSVSILSLLTQEVIEEKEFTGMETKIDVSSLSEGIYLVKLARDTRYVRLVVQ